MKGWMPPVASAFADVMKILSERGAQARAH